MGRSQDPPKPAPSPAAVHPEHSFDLADARAHGAGGSTIQGVAREMHLGVDPLTPKLHARNLSTSTLSPVGGAMTYLDPDPVSHNGASYEMQGKHRRSAPVPIIAAQMEKSEPPMPDHAPPSIPTYSTTPASAPPIVSPPPPGPTPLDYSKIPDPTVRKAAEKAAAKAMKVWEKRVKDYEGTVKDWEKAIEKNERKKCEKAKKEERKSTTPHDSGVERLRREKERMERKERRLKGIPEPPVSNAPRQSAPPTKFRTNPFPIHIPPSIANPLTPTVPSPNE